MQPSQLGRSPRRCADLPNVWATYQATVLLLGERLVSSIQYRSRLRQDKAAGSIDARYRKYLPRLDCIGEVSGKGRSKLYLPRAS